MTMKEKNRELKRTTSLKKAFPEIRYQSRGDIGLNGKCCMLHADHLFDNGAYIFLHLIYCRDAVQVPPPVAPSGAVLTPHHSPSGKTFVSRCAVMDATK